MTKEQYQAELAELEARKRELAELDTQVKERQEKTNRIARQILQIAMENNLSIGDLEQALNTVKAFQRVHARIVFAPDVFDAWASPKGIFSMGADFEKGMQLLN